jgi:TatA/E family protein of Tat protein translocase
MESEMLSLPGLLIVAFVILVLFGRGKVSGFFADLAQGVSSFRREIGNSEPGADLPLPAPDRRSRVNHEIGDRTDCI